LLGLLLDKLADVFGANRAASQNQGVVFSLL